MSSPDVSAPQPAPGASGGTGHAGTASAMAIADTVLFEGYTLYPYRANDTKNRVRWQFGVLAPPGFVALDPSERDHLQTECLLEGHDVELTVHVRFLHVQQRTVEAAGGDGRFVPVDSLDVGDATYLPWDEAVVADVPVRVQLPGRGAHTHTERITLAAAGEVESLGRTGRLCRSRRALSAELRVEAEPFPGPYGVRRVRIRLANQTPWARPSEPNRDPNRGTNQTDRPDALRSALVAAHLLIEAGHGAFVSLVDPPEWARPYTEQCAQIGVHPVLAGPPGDRSLVLASPIILYDHPQVAPESAMQFCDATEMDEMLTLRTLTLTDEEKRQVRGSDPRGAQLIDQLDSMPPELMDRLHGAIRSMTAVARQPDQPASELPWWDAVVDAAFHPDSDVLMVSGRPVGRGASVRLRPAARGSDAQDMFLAGRIATVEAVIADVDGAYHLAVSLDDLVEDGYHPHGRYLYFAPDEVEPIAAEPRECAS